MRQRKIRGQKRRQKAIEHWRLENLSLDLNNYLLSENDRYYTKIDVCPWNGLSLINSAFPEPSGTIKNQMLNGLIDIYENWKSQLDQLNQSYYLKIWLFEPRFSQSQIVCAIGESIDYYENMFYKPDEIKEISLTSYTQIQPRLEEFDWVYKYDEDHHTNMEIGQPEMYHTSKDYHQAKKMFDKLLKKPFGTSKLKEAIGDATELYSFKRGNLWIGGQK